MLSIKFLFHLVLVQQHSGYHGTMCLNNYVERFSINCAPRGYIDPFPDLSCFNLPFTKHTRMDCTLEMCDKEQPPVLLPAL